MRTRTFTTTLIAAAVGLAAVSIPGGCQPRNKFEPPPPPKVTVAQPVSKTVAKTVEFTGTTRATARVDLRARVNGYLKEIRFQDGATVKQDEVLFVLERAPYETALNLATAQQDKAKATVDLKQLQFDRAAKLAERQAITQAELDAQRAELATAKADLAAAAANVAQAELNLGYTEIRAPITGRIGRHLVDIGNLVQTEMTLLGTIESIDPIHAYFNISETEILHFMELLREKQIPDPEQNPPELRLGLGNGSGFPHVGRLDYRELGVDPGTGTILRRGVFENPDQVLIPGLFVHIRAQLGEPESALLVDERAIGTDQRGDYLLVVGKDNIVESKMVTLGIQVGNLRVVESGLQPTDRVVINGLQFARPGATVDPQPGTMRDESGDDTVEQESPPQEEPAAANDELPATPAEK